MVYVKDWIIGINRRKATSQTFCPGGERNGASPDDLTKWEVAKIAGYSPRLRIRMHRVKKEIRTIRSNVKKEREPVTSIRNKWGRETKL